MRNIVFIALSILFIVTPYFKGLYFDEDIYLVSIVVGLLYYLLLVQIIVRKERINLWLLGFLIITPLLYLLSFFYAKTQLGSLHLSIRWIMYLAFFFLLYWSTNLNVRLRKWLPIVFQATGVWIALHVFFNILGWVNFEDALLSDAERYSGVFQYPNTFGIIMAMFFMFSLIMLLDKDLSKKHAILYGGPLVLYLFMFIGSFSRGAFLVFPVILILTFFLIHKKVRWNLLLITLITTPLAFILLLRFTPIIHISLLLLFSLLILVIIFRLKGWRLININFKILLPAIILVSGLLIATDIYIQGSLDELLPFRGRDKITSLSNESSLTSRIVFNLDALDMSLDSPIIGHGGEAWTVLYQRYQDVPYQTTKVHNGFMEILVDLGFFGFIIFIASFLILLYFVIQNLIRGQKKNVHLAVLIGVIAIFAHSAMDFDFGFGTVWFITFWLFAMSLVTERYWGLPFKQLETPEANKVNLTLPVSLLFGVMVTISIIISFQFMQADQAYKRAMKTESIDERVELLTKATKKNKWHREYLFEYGAAKIGIDADKDEVISIANQLVENEPRFSGAYDMAGTLLEAINEDELALIYYLTGIEMDKFNMSLYSKTMELLIEGNSEGLAGLALEVFDGLKAEYDALMEYPPEKRHNQREFGLSNDILLNAGVAYYLTGDGDEIGNLVSLTEDEAAQTVILALELLWLEQEGNLEKINTFKNNYQDLLSEIEVIRAEWDLRLNIQ